MQASPSVQAALPRAPSCPLMVRSAPGSLCKHALRSRSALCRTWAQPDLSVQAAAPPTQSSWPEECHSRPRGDLCEAPQGRRAGAQARATAGWGKVEWRGRGEAWPLLLRYNRVRGLHAARLKCLTGSKGQEAPIKYLIELQCLGVVAGMRPLVLERMEGAQLRQPGCCAVM